MPRVSTIPKIKRKSHYFQIAILCTHFLWPTQMGVVTNTEHTIC